MAFFEKDLNLRLFQAALALSAAVLGNFKKNTSKDRKTMIFNNFHLKS
jgi:hypothetical protein